MTKLDVHGIRRLGSRVGQRVAFALRDAPLLFLGIVLGVAILFRVAVGWAKSATIEPTADPAVATAPSTAVTTAHAPSASKPANEMGTGPGAGIATTPSQATPLTASPLSHKKPRNHGRR